MAAKEDYLSAAPHMVNMRKLETYAVKNKIAFAYEQVKSVPNGRELAWSKVLIFAKYYQKFDEIVWIDTALELKDESVNIFDKFTDVQKGQIVKPVFVIMRANFEYDTRIIFLDARDKTIVKEYLDSYWGDAKSPEISDSIVINHMWPRLYRNTRRIAGVYLTDVIGPLSATTVKPEPVINPPTMKTEPVVRPPVTEVIKPPTMKAEPALRPAVTEALIRPPVTEAIKPPTEPKKTIAMIVKYLPQYGVHDDTQWFHLREAFLVLGYEVTLYANNITASSPIRALSLTVEPANTMKKHTIVHDTMDTSKNVFKPKRFWYPLYSVTKYAPRATKEFVLVTFSTDFVSLILLEHLNSDNLKKVHVFSTTPFKAEHSNGSAVLAKVKQHNTITIKDLLNFFANATYMPQNVYFLGDSEYHDWYNDVCSAAFPLVHFCPEAKHLGTYTANMLEITEASFGVKPYAQSTNAKALEELRLNA
jgi:hypothetical protein